MIPFKRKQCRFIVSTDRTDNRCGKIVRTDGLCDEHYKMITLGLLQAPNRKASFSEDDISFVKENLHEMTFPELAYLLECSVRGVQELARRHGLKKNTNNVFCVSLKRKVFEMDGWACVLCGYKACLDCHHIDEDKYNNSIENLVTLCPNHHREYHAGLIDQQVIINAVKNRGIIQYVDMQKPHKKKK